MSLRDYSKLLGVIGMTALCVMCRDRAHQHNLCRGCRDDLPRIVRSCERCAAPLVDGATPICGACVTRAPPWDRALAAFRYEFPVDALLHALKYRGRLAVGRALGVACAVEFAPRLIERPDVIAPVTLHWRRNLARGFNQSLEIARPLACAVGVPLAPQLLRRVRATAEQTRLDAAARRANVRGAFMTRTNLRGKSVAIVDDVMTTGATMAAATRCLRDAGAERIEAWVCARAVR